MDISERIKKRRTMLGMTQTELATLSFTSQQNIAKLESGKISNPRNIKELAEALKTSPEYLRFGAGELDNAQIIAPANNYVPMLSMVQAGVWTEIEEKDIEEVEYYPCPVKCGPNTFIVRVEGDSMLPKFHQGDLLYVDPCAQADNGSFVVARLDDDNQATFKQLIIDAGKKYLKALNPDWPNKFIEINGNCTIVGKVIFTGTEL